MYISLLCITRGNSLCTFLWYALLGVILYVHFSGMEFQCRQMAHYYPLYLRFLLSSHSCWVSSSPLIILNCFYTLPPPQFIYSSRTNIFIKCHGLLLALWSAKVNVITGCHPQGLKVQFCRNGLLIIQSKMSFFRDFLYPLSRYASFIPWLISLFNSREFYCHK